MKTNIVLATLILTLGLLIGVGVTWPLLNQYLELKTTEVKNTAIDQCSQNAVSKWTDEKNKAEITEPYQPAYDRCMKNKGY